MALVSAALPARLLLRDLLKTNNTAWETSGELLGIFPKDWLHDVDRWKKSVGSGRNRAELGVVGSNAFDSVHAALDSLSWAQLGHQDLWVDWCDCVLAGEVLRLITDWLVDDILCVDVCVDVLLIRISLPWCGSWVEAALDVQVERDNVVVVRAAIWNTLFRDWLLVPLDEVEQTMLAALQRDEAESGSQNFVLDDRGVVRDINVLNGEGRNLCDTDATECISDRGVNADQGERCVERVVVIKLDLQILLELLQIPGVVLSGVVAREISGGDIVDSLKIDADNLAVC